MCDYGESPTAWSETWRTARKTHRCCACGETVRPGDRYHYLSGVWDGSPGSYKHCARCWTMFKMIEDVAEVFDEGGIRLDLACGELWRDNFSDPEPTHLAFLTPDEAQELTNE